MSKSLKHIAIIMDGNGRWARQRNLPLSLGHKRGAEAARNIIISCIKRKIPYLTLYTFSSENWKRNNEEVDGLITLLKIYLTDELDLLIKNKIRVRFIGDRNKFSSDIIDLLNKCEELTHNNDKLFLQIALSYGARDEIIYAQKRIFTDLNSGKLKVEELNEELFGSYMYTNSIPDPDLFIRTSGEYRISNFLLWQIAYTELYFTKTLWPDFSAKHLSRAINNFNKRERRYGLSKQIL
ncbi:MAG: polyprenyl diphosphate synthase [Pseudomonadota bacterium]